MVGHMADTTPNYLNQRRSNADLFIESTSLLDVLEPMYGPECMILGKTHNLKSVETTDLTLFRRCFVAIVLTFMCFLQKRRLG